MGPSHSVPSMSMRATRIVIRDIVLILDVVPLPRQVVNAGHIAHSSGFRLGQKKGTGYFLLAYSREKKLPVPLEVNVSHRDLVSEGLCNRPLLQLR